MKFLNKVIIYIYTAWVIIKLLDIMLYESKTTVGIAGHKTINFYSRFGYKIGCDILESMYSLFNGIKNRVEI